MAGTPLSPPTTPYYGGGQVANPANVIYGVISPPSNNAATQGGLVYIDTVLSAVYISSKPGTWVAAASGAGTIDTLTGNTGGALNPTLGNINIIGAGALAIAGSGSTLTGTITPGTALIATLTGGSGGALSPTTGNFNILGTANQLTSTGSGSTITFSIPATFTAPGSVASTTTLTAGSSLSVTTSATVGTTLGVTGVTTLAGLTQLGTASINASGAGVTTIGTGGTGATNIGNATGNTAVTGSLTATTSLTATLGAITATNGNLVLVAAGNKMLRSSVATTTTGGANSIGSVTLVAGTATVATTAVTTNSLIQIWRQSIGATGAAALGELSVGTITNGSSFVINAALTATATSLATTDVSVVGWEIIN